ncbi:hypothetical protein [Ancylomarina sp.]|uniref:hypothetical protein n=1 Tax=Ancylomarina sp. TaxID=1970196 RepID=UPI00356A96B6
MKKLMFVLMISLLIGCTDDDTYVYYDHHHQNSVVLLQVNYTDYEFEGGTELFLHSEFNDSDTLPIRVDYVSPGDFGSLGLYYEPKSEPIFKGTIIWSGTGERMYPYSLYHPRKFLMLQDSIDMPDSDDFQILFPEEGVNYPLDSIWNSISHLAIVSRYLESGKKVGVFRYTRSVGAGNPNEWDWYVVMNTQPEK